MKKVLTALALTFLYSQSFAQTLKDDGRIVDKNARIIGYYRNGEIQDEGHHILGLIHDDGTITKGRNNVIGRIKDGKIYSGYFNEITIKPNGALEDGHWQTVANVSSQNVGTDNMAIEAVIRYFFFK